MATRDVGNLRTRLSWEDNGTKRSLTGFRDDLKNLKSEMNATKSRGKEFANSLKGLKQQSDILNRTFKTQEQRVKELRHRYQESKRVKGEDAKQTKNLSRQYNNAVAQMNRTEKQLKQVTEEINRQINPWRKLGASMQSTGQRMQDFGRGMSNVGRTMTMRVTTPILGLAGAALKVAADFEEGMSRVQAVSGATGDEMKQLEEMAKNLGATTRFSAREAASGMEYLARAGFKTNEILTAMPGLLNLAATENMDLGRAADIASNILSGFNLEASESGRVSDVLAKGASTANTSVEQLGDAMKYVAPVASTLGIELEDMTAAIGRMSDSGIQGEAAGRQLRMGLLRLAKPTKEASGLIEELGINIFDANGNMKSMPEIVGELNGGLRGMKADARAAALATLFGAESTAGWSVLLETGQKDLSGYTKELNNAEGAAAEMAKVMEDNAKGSVREFRSALESAGIAASEHLLPAFTDLVEKGTELIRKFGELDESQQKTIIKMAGVAAAAGPALLVMGGLTNAIGGVVRVGGGLFSLLGKAGGAGLLGRIAGFGVGGPVGLAIGGLSLLLPLLANVKAEKQKLHEVSWDNIESMQNEVVEIDKLIDRFGQLQTKNQLTTDEVLRYMDIMDQLKQTDNPQTIKALTDEQQRLLEKSGLTNDEMGEFLRLNDQVIEKAPDTKKAISDEGNAFAENLSILKQLNAEKREELVMNAERELEKTLENEKQLLHDQKTYVSEIKDLDKQINDNRKERLTVASDLNAQEVIQRDIDNEIKNLKDEIKNLDGDALIKAQSKLEWLKLQKSEQDTIVEGLQFEKNKLIETGDKLAEKLKKKQKDLDLTREDLKELDKMKWDYEQLILAQVGLNSEKGKGLDTLIAEINKQKAHKAELRELHDQGKLNTAEYQNQIGKIDTQIGKLESAKGNLRDMNKLAGETIYKDINISEKPSVLDLNRRLSNPISKVLNITTSGGGHYVRGYATGTDHHPGGGFIAGEEGWELGRMGNRWEMLNLGRYSRPAGYEVFTHDESKKIISALNNMPAYASGVSPSGEANRVVGQLNNKPMNDSSGQVVSLLQDIARGIRDGKVIQVDGRTITQVVNEKNALSSVGNYF